MKRQHAARRQVQGPSAARHFGERLRHALAGAHCPAASPADLAREFNLRFPAQAISVAVARRWLRGDAMPCQEDIDALAEWLGLRRGWLGFDGPVPASEAQEVEDLAAADRNVMSDLLRLDQAEQDMARELIAIMAGRRRRLR